VGNIFFRAISTNPDPFSVWRIPIPPKSSPLRYCHVCSVPEPLYPSRFDISFIFVLIYDYRTKKLSYLNQYCFGSNFTPHGSQINHIDLSDRAGFVLLFLFLTFSSSAIFFPGTTFLVVYIVDYHLDLTES